MASGTGVGVGDRRLRPAALVAITLIATGAAIQSFLQAPIGPRPPGQAASPARQGAEPSTRTGRAPGMPRSLRNANYSIDVRLDPERRTLTGREILTWRNVTASATPELQLHLYYNAWKNSSSTWMRERRLARRPGLESRPAADWGWIDVTAVRLLGAGAAPPIDLTARTRHIAPDDGNQDDQTVMAVPLPTPALPGDTVNLEIEWTSRVPRTFARTGTIGNYYFIAQWFPKVGVLEEAGWNSHQFHSATEFFADYGVYDVRITAPSGWVLGATGIEREVRDNSDGTTTHRYYQEDVHDFAWSISPDFLDLREDFEHPTLPRVEMRLLLQPEHAGQAARHFDATRATLRTYGEWFGAYPFDHITVVDPAWQSGSGGMEYPTLLTAGTRWLAPADVAQPESVTIHEAGHQFWYSAVGNNEFEHAWLDEGLNTFSTARALEIWFSPHYRSTRFFGGFVPWVFRDIPWSRAIDGNRLTGYRANAGMDRQSTRTFEYWPGTAGSISYNKTALWLHTLERHLGWPVLQRSMSIFYDRWLFGHPSPHDFFDSLSGGANEDLSWFFDQVHDSAVVFDYGVQQLTSRPVGARGYFDDERGPAFADHEASGGPYETTVVVRRFGAGIFPVDVVIEFDDGSVERERWDGAGRWTAFEYTRAARATRAFVDPNRVLLLDIDFTNNSRTLAPRANAAATKWSLTWLVWLQDALLSYGFFV